MAEKNLEAYEVEKEKLDQASLATRFLVTFLPFGVIDLLLSKFLYMFGRLGYLMSRVSSFFFLLATLYFIVNFDESPYYNYRLKKIED